MKQVSVDWDSIDSLTNHIRRMQLRKRERELERKGNGPLTAGAHGKRFEACNEIWSTSILHIYSDLSLRTERVFFVYAHLNPREMIELASGVHAFAATLGMTHLPFYVGKGVSGRDKSTTRNETHRKVMQRLGNLGTEPIVVRVAENLTEAEALQAESKLIDIFGLVPNGGLLCNLDEGHHRTQRRMMYRDALLKLGRTARDCESIKKELFGIKL